MKLLTELRRRTTHWVFVDLFAKYVLLPLAVLSILVWITIKFGILTYSDFIREPSFFAIVAIIATAATAVSVFTSIYHTLQGQTYNRVYRGLRRFHSANDYTSPLDILPAQEREDLVAEVRREIHKGSAAAVVSELEAKVEELLAREEPRKRLLEAFNSTAGRLGREMEDTKRRGNVNLSIGVAMGFVGVIVFALIVFSPMNARPNNVPEFLINFLPRLSLLVFVELLAFFFLRLYKVGLAEIRYYQNELTNIESKRIALSASIYLWDYNSASSIVINLANTERNGALEKGQSTVELESLKHREESIARIIKDLATVFNAANEKK